MCANLLKRVFIYDIFLHSFWIYFFYWLMCVNLLNRVFIADIFFLQHIFQMNTSREQDCEECNQINIHPQAQARRLPPPPMTRSQSSPEVTVIQTASPARRFFHMLPVAACRICLKQEATTPPLSTTTR